LILKSINPTAKPLDFTNFIVKHHSKPGQVVLDLFSGSGTFAEVFFV